MMYPVKERSRHTWKKGTPSAPNSSRTYDLPNSSTDALPLNDETPGGVGRLTRSKVTNFPYTARIEMSKVILFRNDKSRWSMLSPVF